MAIKVCLEDVLKERGMTSKELCSLVNITEANLSVLRSGKAIIKHVYVKVLQKMLLWIFFWMKIYSCFREKRC